MCFAVVSDKFGPVEKVIDTSGQLIADNNSNNSGIDTFPTHVDNPFLNTDVKSGILGFRYETKSDSITIYSNVQTKTFCLIMGIEPLKQ